MEVVAIREKIRKYIQTHVRESIIMLIIGVLCFYILIGMSMPVWQRLLVIAVLVFGGFEVLNRMHGKPSNLDQMRKGIQQVQAQNHDLMGNMEFPGVEDIGGFGPFQQRRPRKKR